MALPLAASLGIVDHEAEAFWLVDASPDICEQMNLLVADYPTYRLAGILLTHAHVGHYLGLVFVGESPGIGKTFPFCVLSA